MSVLEELKHSTVSEMTEYISSYPSSTEITLGSLFMVVNHGNAAIKI